MHKNTLPSNCHTSSGINENIKVVHGVRLSLVTLSVLIVWTSDLGSVSYVQHSQFLRVIIFSGLQAIPVIGVGSNLCRKESSISCDQTKRRHYKSSEIRFRWVL